MAFVRRHWLVLKRNHVCELRPRPRTTAMTLIACVAILFLVSHRSIFLQTVDSFLSETKWSWDALQSMQPIISSPSPRLFDVIIYNGEIDMLYFRYKVSLHMSRSWSLGFIHQRFFIRIYLFHATIDAGSRRRCFRSGRVQLDVLWQTEATTLFGPKAAFPGIRTQDSTCGGKWRAKPGRRMG